MLDALKKYSSDVKNPQCNFDLALEYDKIGHTASAISFYLRAAELSEDLELTYSSLLRMALCFERQGNRNQTVTGLYKQAINVLPNRPESYYYLAKIENLQSNYHTAYTLIHIALNLVNSDILPLRYDVDYPGEYGLFLEKITSCWFWGKTDECRNLIKLCKLKYFDQMSSYDQAKLIEKSKEYNVILDKTFFELEYQKACDTFSDISENLPILFELAKECDHVTEMGVRTGVSTRAFLNTDVTLRSYDLYIDDEVNSLFGKAKQFGKDASYIKANVLDIEIEETDLLFIDTWHCYDQLKEELKIHPKKVRKYIAFHDTHTFGLNGEPYSITTENGYKESPMGLLPAIIEFLIEHPEWKFKIHKTNNNGLTVIERI